MAKITYICSICGAKETLSIHDDNISDELKKKKCAKGVSICSECIKKLPKTEIKMD